MYQNDEALTKFLLGYKKFETDTPVLDAHIRKTFSEIYFQVATQLIRHQSTMQSIFYLSKSIQAFPAQEAYLLLSRVFARAGREKEANDIILEWEQIAECSQ